MLTFITNTVFEERVLQQGQKKRQAEAKVIKAGKFNQDSTAMERRQLLVRVND